MGLGDKLWDIFRDNFNKREQQVLTCIKTPNMIRNRFGNIPKISIELHPSTLYLRGVEAGDAGDYACEAVDARSGAVVFTAVTTLAVSGDFHHTKLQPAAQDIWYLSFSPSEKSDKFTTSLAWLRHTAWVNKTGMGRSLRRLGLNSSLVDPDSKPQPRQ